VWCAIAFTKICRPIVATCRNTACRNDACWNSACLPSVDTLTKWSGWYTDLSSGRTHMDHISTAAGEETSRMPGPTILRECGCERRLLTGGMYDCRTSPTATKCATDKGLWEAYIACVCIFHVVLSCLVRIHFINFRT